MSNDKLPNEAEDEGFGPDILTLEDENGEEFLFEVVDDTDIEGTRYLAVVPYIDGEDDIEEDDVELLLMRASEIDGEEVLDIVDDAAELQKIGKIFAGRLEEMYEIDVEQLGELLEEDKD